MGKSALLESGNQVTDCIDQLAVLLHDSCTELKITVLNTLASLVKLDRENQSPEMLSVTESWFRRSPDLIVTVAGLIKQPSENVKEGKLERWRLVERLVETRHTKQLLGPQIDLQMR